MKGMQKRSAQQRGVQDTEITGFEVQPITVLLGSLGFVVLIILLHFWGKVVAPK